jgi:ribokinase
MLVRAPRVDSIDSVAAGDVFAGAFAVSYCNRKDFVQATEYANYAAALSTTRKGAQPSVPTAEEVSRLIDKIKPQYILNIPN